MKNLIGMTDFALEQSRTNDIDFIQGLQKLERIYKYANFLKQPLVFGMFVPCDEYGNVLEVDTEHKEDHNSWSMDEIQQYQQAKERCLFEGFEIIEMSYNFKVIIESIESCQVFASISGEQFYKCNEFEKIEDIVKYNLQLTPTALKQIGL